MAEENVPRSKGVVKRFNDVKGYGFIQPDEGGNDLFVHQTAIVHDGYRTLSEGQVVEFTIILDEDNKTRAVDVTAPGGGPVDSTSRKGNGGKSRGGGRGVVDRRNDDSGYVDRRSNGNGHGYRSGVGGGGGGGRACYTCNEYGHLARDCDYVGGGVGGGGAGGACYNCGGVGHLARECTSGARGSRGEERTCYTCNEPGHLARDCRAGGGEGVYSRGGGGDKKCYSCGEPGHLSRDCAAGGGGERNGYSRGGGGGDRSGNSRGGGGSGKLEGGRGGDCYNCGKPGHFARDCKQAPRA